MSQSKSDYWHLVKLSEKYSDQIEETHQYPKESTIIRFLNDVDQEISNFKAKIRKQESSLRIATIMYVKSLFTISWHESERIVDGFVSSE